MCEQTKVAAGKCVFCGRATDFLAYSRDLCLYCGDVIQTYDAGKMIDFAKMCAEKISGVHELLDIIENPCEYIAIGRAPCRQCDRCKQHERVLAKVRGDK